MEPIDYIKSKVAKSLLIQRNSRERKRLILWHGGALFILFLMHTYFSNLGSALKLIPQTMTAIGMGYVLLSILSLRRFIYLIDFIDWEKVTESVEQQVAPPD